MKRRIILLSVVSFLIGCSGEFPEKKHESVIGSQVQPDKTQAPHPVFSESPFKPAFPIIKNPKNTPAPVESDLTEAKRDTQNPPLSRNDSMIQERIRFLRSRNFEMDFNEPANRQVLSTYLNTGEFPSLILLSKERYLTCEFDNDILNNTDRFYTNGIHFRLIHPALQSSPLSKLMIPYWQPAINYYGISLVQNMYTPSTTKTGGIPSHDRPYASYLYIGSFKISNDKQHRFRQTSELQIGILGPSSLGEFVQKSFHQSVPTNHEPLGWEYQIQDDLLLNYLIRFEKGVIACRHFEINLTASGVIGSVSTKIDGGVYLRTGRFNPFFANLFLSKKKTNQHLNLLNWQLYFFVQMTGNLIGYDATLQGGMFNRSSVYTIPSGDINRLIFSGSAGITGSYGGIQIHLEQFLLSPEFHNGWWHKWIGIGLTFAM